MIELVPARITHVGPIAAKMREIDRVEATAMGRTPKDALRIGLRCSTESLTALDRDRRPVAMMGVVPISLMTARGMVWLLGTDEVFRYGRPLLTLGPPIIARWLQTFELLENVVATANGRAIRLLERWGADMGSQVQVHRGVEFVPFRFERRREDFSERAMEA